MAVAVDTAVGSAADSTPGSVTTVSWLSPGCLEETVVGSVVSTVQAANRRKVIVSRTRKSIGYRCFII
jgi:hypothetical protein